MLRVLNYGLYIRQCVEGKNYTISDTGNNLLITYDKEIIFISFETRIVHTQLPSALTLPYNILTKMRIASLAYGIVSINRRVTFVTSEVLTARHDCVFDIFANKLHAPLQLVRCKAYNRYWTMRPSKRFLSGKMFCTKKSHRLYWDPKCQCNLCVKKGPASLRSLCVYKLYDRLCNTSI
jgi:hypothetical protein